MPITQSFQVNAEGGGGMRKNGVTTNKIVGSKGRFEGDARPVIEGNGVRREWFAGGITHRPTELIVLRTGLENHSAGLVAQRACSCDICPDLICENQGRGGVVQFNAALSVG